MIKLSKYKRLTVIMFVILAIQMIGMINSQGIIQTNNHEKKVIKANNGVKIDQPASPGFENIKANVIENSDFEEEDTNGKPSTFNSYCTAYRFGNASYQDDVYAGSYSMYYNAKGTNQQGGGNYISRPLTYGSVRAYLVEDITLDLWFKTEANPDLGSGAYSRMYVRVSTGSADYYLYYYFSFSGSIPGNSGNNGFFDVRQPIGSWYNLQRNITSDFETAFPSITITSDFYARYIYFQLQSPQSATGFLESLVDEIALTNSSAYNFLWTNGDFEFGTGDYWNIYNNGPAFATLTDEDYTSGARALNLTASAFYDSSTSTATCENNAITTWTNTFDSYYPYSPGEVVLNFDWKYSDTINGGTNQYSMFFIHFQNDTFNNYIYYTLGDHLDVISLSNQTYSYSTYRYHAVPELGSRDTWEHFSMDLYDLHDYYNFSDNMIPTYLGWTVNAGYNKNSTVNLFVDNFHLIADPLGDPSFEQAKHWTTVDPLASWTSLDHNYVNRTTDAYTGNYAANITSANGAGSIWAYRDTFVPLQENLYADFWWRIDKFDGSDYAFSSIQLEFDDSRFIEYILGYTDSTTLTNSSNLIYILDVANQNQTGTWFNFFRNIEEDFFGCYGEFGWNLTSVELRCYTMGTTTVSTTFDDLYLVQDVAGPTISNPIQTPLNPQYYEPVTIEVDVEDNTAVTTVEMYYKIGSDPWASKLMTNVGGIHYETSLLNYDYNTRIQYYFESEDMYGLESSLGSESTPFEYTVTDLTDPILTVEAPPTNESLVGTVVFNITGSDVGSDIASFTISVDSEIIIDENIVPATFSWATTNHENGQHIIVFVLEDNAGNNETIQLEYTINNPIPWYIKTRDFFVQYWPYLTAGGGALIVGIIAVVITIRIRRRKKLA